MRRWDRCEELGDSGPKSYRLTGSGRAVIAWNCVGMSSTYTDANFERGGIFDSSTSCHSPGGGGTVVLCSSGFEKASIAVELAQPQLCNLTSPNIGIGLAISRSLSSAVSLFVSLLVLLR